MTSTVRVFLLSPAHLGRVRGRRIFGGSSSAPFMAELGEGGSVPLGDVYQFISSLYYRGKRAYAETFGRGPGGGTSTWTITPTRGLVPDAEPVTLDDLRALAAADIDLRRDAYREGVTATARALDHALGERGEIVLLGSIASSKYVDPLLEVFGPRLHFPRAFIGRGDMSRGGLLLRAVADGRELDYVCALGADRRGPRPPRLDPT